MEQEYSSQVEVLHSQLQSSFMPASFLTLKATIKLFCSLQFFAT